MKSGYQQMPRITETALTEIRWHLPTVYWLSRLGHPGLMVELGVRSGETTRAMLAAAMDVDGKLLSYDIDGDSYHVPEVTQARGIDLDFGRWECRQCDSVAASGFHEDGSVGMLLIDTIHSFEHTQRELWAWGQKIRTGGVIACHDTGITEPGRDGVQPAMELFCQEHQGWRLEVHNNPGDQDCGMGTGLGILWKLP